MTGTTPTARPGAAVTIDGVSVTYPDGEGGEVRAVEAATLDIAAGSIVALLGPSGCGKTSLLRAIAGLERPTSGRVRIDDRVVSDAGVRGNGGWVPPERRHVGMVFQDGALFPHLTVADNIAFGLRTTATGLSRSDRGARVDEMLRLIDLTKFADRLPGTLSGGQQQRVALARSLAPQPSVLLLDEPFSALDAGLRVQVRAEVAHIVRAVGVTTVFVTHDQDEAFVLGDEVAVLRDGRIEQLGTPDELYRQPRTPWIAGFVGEANFVAGRMEVRTGGDATSAATALGAVPIVDRGSLPDAADVDVLVRPEQLMLSGEIGETSDGAAIGTIVSTEYYGHDVRYEVRLDDGSVLAARTQSPELLDDGQRVGVRFIGRPTQAWPTR